MPGDEERQLFLPNTGAETTIKIIGTEFTKNGWPWNMVLVFPVETEQTKEKFAAKMPSPTTHWGQMFTGRQDTGKMPASIKDGMTRKEFSHAVFEEIVSILGGDHNGLQLATMPSIDGDEMFLMVALTDEKAKSDLADAEEFDVKLSDSAYGQAKLDVPTDMKVYQGHTGKFEKVTDQEQDGEKLENTFPAYLKYSCKRQHQFSGLGPLDVLRVVKRRINYFMSLNHLIDAEVCSQCFPVHHWDDGVNALYKKGWNDPTCLLRWPSEHKSDCVNAYLGPELGFFFHWFNFLTRWLLVPALLGCVTYTLRITHAVSRTNLNYTTMGFGAFLIIWSSLLCRKYAQAKNLKVMKWGMQRFQAAQEVRQEFQDSYRDTFKDRFQHVGHWALVIFFIFETLAMVAFCANLQTHANKDLKGSTWGMSNEYVAEYPKYIITLNIKIVDKVWTPVSNMLTRRENWRTVQELQENMVVKMFIVKMFVFYYPFVYEIVIKPMTRGCGPEHSHTDLTGCVDSLNENLILFFVTQVGTEIALIIVGILMTAWKVRSEKQSQQGKVGKEYSYLELQAKCAPYAEEDLIADFLNAVVTYGYIVLFGVSLPFMCSLAFVTNFLMKRLLAYKISYAYQRPMPKAMNGIGAWEGIVCKLGYLAVPANAYIAIFTLQAFRDYSIVWKLFMFIVVQNVGFALKMAIEGFVPEIGTPQMRITEYNEDIMDQVLDEQDPVKIGTGKPSIVKSPFA